MTFIENLTLIQIILTRYILVICYILGLLGSLFNLLVFCQKKLRYHSCSIYFIAISIFNVLVILAGMTPVLLTSYLPNEPILNSSAFCKARAYVTHVFLMMSRSTVALACIDRFALCSPSVRIRRLNQRHIAIRSVIFISILWLIIPIHIIIYDDIQMPERRCGASGIYSLIYSIYASVATAIPLVLMLLFSFWTRQNLRHIRARIHPHGIIIGARININMRVRQRDLQFMTILTGEVVVYFLSTVWFPIYSIYMTITMNTSKTNTRLAIEGFIRYLTLSFLIFLNSCSIFYVHLFISKVFRQECKQLIARLFKCYRPIPATPEILNIRKQLNNTSNRQ